MNKTTIPATKDMAKSALVDAMLDDDPVTPSIYTVFNDNPPGYNWTTVLEKGVKLSGFYLGRQPLDDRDLEYPERVLKRIQISTHLFITRTIS